MYLLYIIHVIISYINNYIISLIYLKRLIEFSVLFPLDSSNIEQ